MLRRTAFALLIALTLQAQAEKSFVLVFVDQKTEKAMGPFPYDRSVLAAAVRRATALGARGVVLKFFLPTPKSPEGDRALADAMAKTKVLLEAGFGSAENGPDLPDRFKLAISAGVPAVPAGGAIPLQQFSARAYDVGFVNISAIDRMPMIELYRGKYVKSLVTACIELALNEPAHIMPGIAVEFGKRSVGLDQQSQADVVFPRKDDLTYIPLVDFLDAKSRFDVKDRIVIVGLDVARTPTIPTPLGPIGPHRAFFYALRSVYESLR